MPVTMRRLPDSRYDEWVPDCCDTVAAFERSGNACTPGLMYSDPNVILVAEDSCDDFPLRFCPWCGASWADLDWTEHRAYWQAQREGTTTESESAFWGSPLSLADLENARRTLLAGTPTPHFRGVPVAPLLLETPPEVLPCPTIRRTFFARHDPMMGCTLGAGHEGGHVFAPDEDNKK